MAKKETVLSFGGELKALGDNRFGGYLVRFTSDVDPDITQDFFNDATDFDTEFPSKATVYWNHGLDPDVRLHKFGKADLRIDEVGVWAETILQERNEYERLIAQWASEGKLGWSSGTEPSLVERTKVGKSWHIDSWPLGLDASLTHTPAEPRNEVIALKSFSELLEERTEDEPKGAAKGVGETPQSEGEDREAADKHINPVREETPMEDKEKEVKTYSMSEEDIQALVGDTAKAAAEESVKAYREQEPADNGGTDVRVTKDPADNPFTSLADQCKAIKVAKMSNGRNVDPRLLRVKQMELDALKAVAGTGASEGDLTTGGYLLEPTLVAEVLKPMHEEGPFTSMVSNLPVGSNSNYGWINGVDETDRATGSRWGGIRGYRLAEGGSITASKPAFRRINWELKKYGVLVYGTDELLADVSQFSTIVQQGAGEELSFMANDDIVNGTGVGGPYGFLSSPCFISITKETGQTATTIVLENLYKMWARFPARNRGNAAWFINQDTEPQLDTIALEAGTSALEPRMVTYGVDGLMRIKGRPVIATEFNPTLGSVGDIVLADMSEYLFWEKGGVQSASSIHVQFTTDETVFRFIYRCDGQTALASALTPYKGTDTQSPFVGIAVRS